ncbi:MAG: M23 family metallopeptidase [Gemmatimonadaceae bacterium]
MRSSILLCTAVFAACDAIDRTARDSAAARDTAAGTVALDSAAREDSVRRDSLRADSIGGGELVIHPDRARRGGVIVALLLSDSTATPRCTWKGTPLACHVVENGVRALVPLPAGDTAGAYVLSMETPNAKVSRRIVVADTTFERELILLSDSLYALVRRRREIARDARAVRQVLGTTSAEQRWSGRWRDPLSGRIETAGYGIERFYAPASDSSRTFKLSGSLETKGVFGGDTASALADLPGWRHAGVDVARALRTTVSAPAAGLVADVGTYTLMGRTVFLDHGQGVFSAYFHLDSVLVRRGDLVRPGDALGRVGRSGLATGPHLHYGIYVHGRDIDPALWHDAVEWMTRSPRALAGRALRDTVSGVR